MGKEYTEKVDVYAFGIVLAEVVSLKNAEDLPRTQAMTLDMIGTKALALKTAPRGFIKIIYHCCAFDPLSRPNFEDISEQLQKMKMKTRSAPNSDPLRRRRSTSLKSSGNP